jgi:hypothetical protein
MQVATVRDHDIYLSAHVPMLIAFTVARYHEPEPAGQPQG